MGGVCNINKNLTENYYLEFLSDTNAFTINIENK